MTRPKKFRLAGRWYKPEGFKDRPHMSGTLHAKASGRILAGKLGLDKTHQAKIKRIKEREEKEQ